MIKINDKNLVDARDIYVFVEVKTPFNDWIKRCIDYADLQQNKDFYAILRESTGGRPRTDYLFTIEAAKEMCIVSATSKAKELRRWLIGLSQQKENFELITQEQIIAVIRMVKVFAIYEYRKKALEKNMDNFIKQFTQIDKNTYSKFHNWRNEALLLGKETLEKRIIDYCITERRAIPKFKNKDSMLNFLGEYEQIKNAVWDLLSSQNKSEIVAKNIANLASEIAKEMKPFLQRLNKTDLFFKKLENNEVDEVFKKLNL